MFVAKSYLLKLDQPVRRGPKRRRKENDQGQKICWNDECGSAGPFSSCQIICTTCQSDYDYAYRQTFEGLLSSLVGHCRATDRRDYGGDANSITHKWVCEQLIACFARCQYSGVPLELENGSAFTTSIARLNNDFGHFPANCVIVCRCFQSAPRKDLGHGTVQWSKSKWDYVVASAALHPHGHKHADMETHLCQKINNNQQTTTSTAAARQCTPFFN